MSVKTSIGGIIVVGVLAAIVLARFNPTAEYTTKDKDSVTFKVYWDVETNASDLRIDWAAPPQGEDNVTPYGRSWNRTAPYSEGHLHLDARNLGNGTQVTCHIIVIRNGRVSETIRSGEKRATCDTQ